MMHGLLVKRHVTFEKRKAYLYISRTNKLTLKLIFPTLTSSIYRPKENHDKSGKDFGFNFFEMIRPKTGYTLLNLMVN
jgi:hypothetical protein